ncbi:hypothetical protein [Acidovorax cavernicola]|uniref:Uncharacterized protein n=1 Tax=Acidovorax cavernicola TaxID=1675792 RepID=A0A9X8D6B7_9BURK|nr:hypothetical protein [Acidovorax cavernicola]RIX81949.1 hypothetical protein D3H34_09235 [Acidovorax cavernicola]
MKDETYTEEHLYTVEVEGRNVTVRDVMVAAFTYRIKLEELLGSSRQVAHCYRLWRRLEQLDEPPMTRLDIKYATAWRDAHQMAWQAAHVFLTDPHTKTFVLRLAHP